MKSASRDLTDLNKFFSDLEMSECSVPGSHTFLMEKLLLEFPVFVFNDDYMKSLGSIVWSKVEAVNTIRRQREQARIAEITEKEQKALEEQE